MEKCTNVGLKSAAATLRDELTSRGRCIVCSVYFEIIISLLKKLYCSVSISLYNCQFFDYSFPFVTTFMDSETQLQVDYF